jgi:hypothetical protein
MAYFWVQERAVDSYLALSVLYMWAISGTSGSSGFGSVSSEQIDRRTCKDRKEHILIQNTCLMYNENEHEIEPKVGKEDPLTFDMVRAGLHCSLRMSRQMLPLLLMFGWNTLVRNETWKILNIRNKSDWRKRTWWSLTPAKFVVKGDTFSNVIYKIATSISGLNYKAPHIMEVIVMLNPNI